MHLKNPLKFAVENTVFRGDFMRRFDITLLFLGLLYRFMHIHPPERQSNQ